MAKTKLSDTDADALMRSFYLEENRDERRSSALIPPSIRLSGQPSISPAARSAARKARRIELLVACALIALGVSPALFDAAQAPLAGKAEEALNQGAFQPLLTSLHDGVRTILRSYSQSYP